MNSPLANEVQKWQELRRRLLVSMPELEDDPECLLDTLEGETNVHERLTGLIRSALRDEAMADGLKSYQDKLAERKTVLKTRAVKKRAVTLHYMEDLDIRKIEAADMTISRRAAQPPVTIYNEDELPNEFMRIKREPDKAAIRKALKEGNEVPGAQLGNISEALQVKI